MYVELAILAVFALIYSTIVGAVERSAITGPIVFTAFGFVAGPLGLGWLEPDISNDDFKLLADLTLAIVLFIDSASSDLGVLRRSFRIPAQMLMLGLPGVIGMGFFVGWLLFDDLGGVELAILATILAATDAALGKGVIANEALPDELREGLNVESGLNDGLCVPILFLLIAIALGDAGQGETGALAFRLVVQEVGIGLIVGLGLTGACLWLIRLGQERGWITDVWAQLPVITLALACFATAQSLHGSGYIASFVGGMLFGSVQKAATHELVRAAEGTAELLSLLVWVQFGTAVIVWAFDYVSWEAVVYALLSLTVIRMLPIFICLTGTGQGSTRKLFLGWFGPRGLASVVFAIIVISNEVPGAQRIAVVVACTVFFSLIAHGVTANPLAAALARRVQRGES